MKCAKCGKDSATKVLTNEVVWNGRNEVLQHFTCPGNHLTEVRTDSQTGFLRSVVSLPTDWLSQ